MGLVGFSVVIISGVVASLLIWNQELDEPESLRVFVPKMAAMFAATALVVWMAILLIENVEPLWLGLLL